MDAVEDAAPGEGGEPVERRRSMLRTLLCAMGRHKRSAKERFRDRDGLLKSRCVHCRVRMVRARGSRVWVAHGSRDFRAQTAPVRALLDRLTGPVIFLLLMAALLGVALWIGGPEERTTPHTPAVRASALTPPAAAAR